jgi:hypothetical protein
MNRRAFTTPYEHLNRHAFTTQYERLNPARIHHADERLSRHAFTKQYERLNRRAHSPRGFSLLLLPRKPLAALTICAAGRLGRKIASGMPEISHR